MHWKRPPTSLEHVPSLAARGLMEPYLRDREFARQYYGAYVSDEDCLRGLARTLGTRVYPRSELARILRDQNRAWGMSGETEEQIGQLEHGALCVFTGQQTGLFTGPLYTVYKALTAIRWAHHLTESLKLRVVPVFWLAADDHDLAEIDHAVVFDGEGHLHTLRYAMSVGDAPPRVSRIRFDDGITAWVRDALAVLPDGPGRDEVAQAIRDENQPGRSWADAFGYLMARWFGRFGLVLVSPDDARLKRLMAPVFLQEIRGPETSRRAVAERSEAIRRAGYSPQVGMTEDGTFLFLDDETGARRRIDLDGDGLVPAGTNTRLSRDELAKRFDDEPERFSANVLLRSVTADAVFPTLAHVMGPGEIAYMAQARALYEVHDVPMPLVVPRARLTIIPEEIAHIIEEESLSLDDVFQPLDRWIGLLAARATERKFGEVIDACRTDLDAAYERLEAAVHRQLPGVWNAVTSARVKTQALMNKLAVKIEQEARMRERRRAGQLKRISDALYPDGAPQERTYCVAPYFVRYGIGFFDAVLDAIEVGNAEHRALWA